MKSPFRLVLWSSLLALIPAAGSAQTHFFIGGGPTGTSAFGFRGGWGGVIAVERRIAGPASFLARVDGSAVPASSHAGISPVEYPVTIFDGTSLGESGAGSRDATLLSLTAGLRLGGANRLSPYLDALVGMGYLNDPANTLVAVPSLRERSGRHTNVALGLGPGIAYRPARGLGLFADVHYEFYFVEGATTPVIPVRMGVLVP